MQKAASRHTVSSELEREPATLAEEELAGLERQYRLLEKDKKSFSEQSEKVIRRQKAEIAALKEELDEINTNMLLIESDRNTKNDVKGINKLSNLILKQQSYEQIITEETDAIAELKLAIKDMKKKIFQQRRKMGGIQSGQAKMVADQREIRFLENKLNKASIDFNLLLTSNTELRQKIESLRSQREVFDSSHKKLMKELNEKKRTMAAIVEQATQAYDLRDDSEAKMALLNDRNDKDRMSFKMEHKELARMCYHDERLKAFVDIKCHNLKSIEEQEQAKRKAGEDINAERTGEETMETYKKSFKSIQKVTGLSNLKLVMKRFLATEDRHFAEFNFINDQNNEVEKLEKNIEFTENSIRKLEELSIKQRAGEKTSFQSKEETFWTVSREAEMYERQVKVTERTLQWMINGIEAVFIKMKCDRSVFTKMLGDNMSVNENNIMEYLSYIELKANDLLQIHTYMQLKVLEDKSNEDSYSLTLSNSAVLGSQPVTFLSTFVHITPPTAEDREKNIVDEIEDFSRPLSLEEMRGYVMEKTRQKERFEFDRDAAQSKSMEKGSRPRTAGPRRKTIRVSEK